MTKFNVVYTIDNNSEQLIFLRMSLDTLLKYNDVDEIYIMYSDVELEKVKAALNTVNHKIHYYPFDYSTIDQTFPKLSNVSNGRIRNPSLVRWFLHRLPLNDFWYVDTDILFASNVRDYLISLQQDNMFVAFDRKIYSSEYKKFKIGTVSNTSDPNAGLLYFNSKAYKDNNVFGEVVEYYNMANDRMKYVNQSAFSWLFDKYRNICKLVISKEYNVKIWNILEYENMLNNIKIHHFNGEDKSLIYRVYNDIMNK